jgi:hypothetical protein
MNEGNKGTSPVVVELPVAVRIPLPIPTVVTIKPRSGPAGTDCRRPTLAPLARLRDRMLTIEQAKKRTEAFLAGQMLEALRAVDYEVPSFDAEPGDVELPDMARGSKFAMFAALPTRPIWRKRLKTNY